MDDTLRLIQYLYGEGEDDSTFARRVSENEALYREYERLRDTKKRLDERPTPRPDAAVVDRIVEEARTAAQKSQSSPRSTADRPARPPARRWTRRLQATGAALALLLVVGLGWWHLPGTSEESTAGSAPEAVGETAQRTTPASAEASTAGSEAVPAWDDRDEVVRIHRRIERLRSSSSPDQWGTLQRVDQRRP